jgi:hypothetical protein
MQTLAPLVALAHWRTLSAYLLNPRRQDHKQLEPFGPVITSQVKGLATTLNVFLESFMKTDAETNKQQASDLEAIILECTKLGYIIFSHPAELRFNQAVEPATRKSSLSLVVCAGLDRLTDRNGNKLEQPVPLAAPVWAKVM